MKHGHFKQTIILYILFKNIFIYNIVLVKQKISNNYSEFNFTENSILLPCFIIITSFLHPVVSVYGFFIGKNHYSWCVII